MERGFIPKKLLFFQRGISTDDQALKARGKSETAGGNAYDMAMAFSRTTRSLAADRGPSQALIIFALGAIFLLWLVWMVVGRVTIYTPSRSARIEAVNTARNLAVSEGGKLLLWHVRAGQKVRAGELVAEFEDEQQKLRLAEAEARLAGYPARIAALEAELGAMRSASSSAAGAGRAAAAAARARSSEASADADFRAKAARRVHADVDAGGSAAIEAERAETEMRRAAATRDARRLDELATSREGAARSAEKSADVASIDETISALKAEQAQAAASVEQLRYALAERQVRAPVDGIIGDLAGFRPGEVLPAGARLATLVPAGHLHVIADFDAAGSLGRLAAGQPARLRVDGFPWAQYGDFSARIAHVAAEARDNHLRIDLTLPAEANDRLALRHGMTGQVDVAVEEVRPFVLVLRSIGLTFG